MNINIRVLVIHIYLITVESAVIIFLLSFLFFIYYKAPL